MFGEYSSSEWIALAFVYLGLALILAAIVRRFVPILARLYLPSSVVAGFLILLLGPQTLGRIGSGWSLVPADSIRVMEQLPGLLINVVFAGIMIGKRLPSLRQIWTESAPHVIMGSVYSFGQFALGGLAVGLVLTPAFGTTKVAGALVEMSFAGGHGTIAGMAGLLDDADAPHLVDVGLGLATISMITGIVGGSLLVKYAIRNPRIPVARSSEPPPDGSPASLQYVKPNSGDSSGDQAGLGVITRAFAAISFAIALAIVMITALRGLLHVFGSNALDDFPLFPFTVIGGFVVQLVLSALHKEELVDRRAVNDLSGLSLDLLIAAAIGTMSLAALSANVVLLVAFSIIAVVWSVAGLLWLGPRLHAQDWFEHGIADYGQSQGNVAAGFILADMADPRHVTTAARAYGYKQLLYEPLLGGGILTAFAVPLIVRIGALPFGFASLVVTALLIVWGSRRARRARSAGPVPS